MQSFPRQILEDGNSVYFGQAIQEVEALLGVMAADNPLSIARKGIDKKITTNQFSLEFDEGRLRSIEFRESFSFAYPPKPFAQEWANLGPIGDYKIERTMTRDQFVNYVGVWELRAQKLGAVLVGHPDLAMNEFRHSFDKDRFCDMFHLAFGPSRRAGGGGIWASGWTAFFSKETDRDWNVARGSELKTLTASCDEFNTVARKAS